MREVLLGIDIGTSACKIAAFLKDGTVLAQAARQYPVYYPRPGWAEQDPKEWWQAVCEALADLWEKGILPEEICGVGVAGQSWSAIAVDEKGCVLCRTPIWTDVRAGEECQWMIKQCGEEALLAVCGNSVQPMYTMPKVLWYRRYLPEVYKRAYKILQSNSFIGYCFTGIFFQDYSQGYGWNCYRMEENKWDAVLCEELGVRSGLLPQLVESHCVLGGVTRAAAAETGLLEGTPVAAGGLDAACAALGVGVIYHGQTQEQGGQAGGMSICLNQPFSDRRLILSSHVIPGHWLLQGGTVGGGAALNWFAREFGEAERQTARQRHTNLFYELDVNASKVPAGSDGLVFLPYLAGERSPIWDPGAKGIFYGIDFSKTRGHFTRAVMEGVAFSLWHNLKTAEEAGISVDVLRAMGGAANSRLWMQIKADVTGKRIEVPSSDTATALGAALLSGVGVGVYSDFEEAVGETIRIGRQYFPDRENMQIYEEGYRIYRNLYRRNES